MHLSFTLNLRELIGKRGKPFLQVINSFASAVVFFQREVPLIKILIILQFLVLKGVLPSSLEANCVGKKLQTKEQHCQLQLISERFYENCCCLQLCWKFAAWSNLMRKFKISKIEIKTLYSRIQDSHKRLRWSNSL